MELCKIFGHKWEKWHITPENSKSQTRECSRCGKMEIEPLCKENNHNWSVWEREPEIKLGGFPDLVKYQTRKCLICNKHERSSL